MWYKATTASVSNGSTIVQILSGDDIGIVQEKGGLIFEGESPVQIKRGYSDGSGNNFIELQSAWPYNDKSSQPLVAFPTDASFAEATAELRRVIDTLSVASTTEAQAGNDDEKIMTPLKTKQAISAQTGTAATSDVTTSNTDATAGRLLKVGDFGIGDNPASFSDWNDIPDKFGGFITLQNNAANKPEGFNENGYLHIIAWGESNDSYIAKVVNNHRIYFLSKVSGTDWIYHGELYHSANSVNPLDYGIGSVTTTNATSLSDPDYIKTGGTIISAALNNITDRPPQDDSLSSRYIVTFEGDTSNGVQTAVNRTTGTTYKRPFNPSGAQGWQEVFDSSNSVNPLDYGLGSQSAISSFADYNQINAGGFGFFVPTSEGNPLGSSISVLNMPSNVGSSSYRIIGRYVTNQNRIYVESVNAGVSRGVDEILHTGNSNLDDFHSDGVAGNLIAIGEAVSPTILRFYLPLNSKKRPTGITITSTFSAYKQGAGLISNTNQITLNAGLSSPKVGVLEISGSGFTTGDNINLRAYSTTSGIRFNF